MNPMVSIVIPVYNGSNYLREAIDSALAQTYENTEVIVVNDGSSDDTEEIALSYGDRIRYFAKENGGVSTALNLGISEMRGEYFSWLSHDDLYYPEKIEAEIKALRKHGDMTAIVYSDYDTLGADTGEIARGALRGTLANMDYSRERITSSVFPVIKFMLHGCALLIHRSHFERVGHFDPQLKVSQDYDMWLRMFRGQRSVFVDESTIAVRRHNRQGSVTIPEFWHEAARLRLKFANSLTHGEICNLFGSKYKFCSDLCFSLFRKRYDCRYAAVYKEIHAMYQNEDIPEETSEKLKTLRGQIQMLSDGKATEICIFGAGVYGTLLCHVLKNRLIRVDFFADNDEGKRHIYIDGTKCLSFAELKEAKDRTLVIVANRRPEDMLRQLAENGFPHVTTKQALDRILEDVPPLKWIGGLEALKDVDYSSKDVRAVIDAFNKLVFDICDYYEMRAQN